MVIPVQPGQGVGLFTLWCQASRKGCWDEGLDTSTPVTVFFSALVIQESYKTGQ